VASAMALILIGIVALCPALLCPLVAASQTSSDSCCHKSQTHSAPCPPKTVPDCPYSILEKSKTNPAATHAKWVEAVVRTEPPAALPLAGLTVLTPCRLIDSSSLFLRNRVLLI
jgi:hypothetical protein